MAREIPFDEFQKASVLLGTKHAEHIAKMGATMKGYTSEQEELLTGLFKDKVVKRWQEINGTPLTDDQIDSLEESFNKKFRATLSLLAHD
jgi:hypothetical protein